MTDRVALLTRAYELFNARQVEELLAMMTDDVEWPDVPNGVVLRGRDAIRPYWLGQFAVADPIVTPTGFVTAGDDVVAVIDQVVLAKDGTELVPHQTVFHRYSFDGDLVRRMRVFTDRDTARAVD